jgi:hypothetical protein
LFDVVLIAAIGASVLVVMLDSIIRTSCRAAGKSLPGAYSG